MSWTGVLDWAVLLKGSIVPLWCAWTVAPCWCTRVIVESIDAIQSTPRHGHAPDLGVEHLSFSARATPPSCGGAAVDVHLAT